MNLSLDSVSMISGPQKSSFIIKIYQEDQTTASPSSKKKFSSKKW